MAVPVWLRSSARLGAGRSKSEQTHSNQGNKHYKSQGYKT